jgi:signal transduction histidine kinase
VLVCIEDDGIGIPPEDLPPLFNRFHRARNAATYPGNGLGLAIVKAVADAHGGKISVESSGHGTRFELSLPSIVS